MLSIYLKVVTNEKIGGSGVTSTLGFWYGGVVMGVLLSFNEAAILYRDFNSAPSQKQNIIVFAANNSRCCECHVAPTIIYHNIITCSQCRLYVLMCVHHGLVSATKT
jgi:hypothetical protein